MPRKAKIHPSPQPAWAIYVRTSDDEAQNVAASQQRQMDAIQRNLIDQTPMSVYAIYRDAHTGRDPQRPEYQRMFHDARQGRFSHIAVESIDRFGRDLEESARAFKELGVLGVELRIANQPTMRLGPENYTERWLASIEAANSQNESERTGARVRGGMRVKALNGGHTGMAPFGYKNEERRLAAQERHFSGRYTRWITPDPETWEAARTAWDLLLTDIYSLDEICHILQGRGYTMRQQRPFVLEHEGKTRTAKSTLSRMFHNPFYAGWVTSHHVDPFSLRGQWQAMVTDDEFERAQAILAKRKKERVVTKQNFYLLKSMLYLQLANGQLRRLVCGTPNGSRPGGGTPYYCLSASNINIPCALLDNQIPQVIDCLNVTPELLEPLRACYRENLGQGFKSPEQDIHRLKLELEQITRREVDGLRERLNGYISDDAWQLYASELRTRRQTIERQIVVYQQSSLTILRDLDEAIGLLTHISRLYATLSSSDQHQLLRLLVEKIIVSEDGRILRVHLQSPFGYLHSQMTEAKKRLATKKGSPVESDHLNGAGKENGQVICSFYVASGDPTATRVEKDAITVDELHQLTEFPTRRKLQKLFTI